MDRHQLRLNQASGIVVALVGTLMTANFWPPVRALLGGWRGAIMWGVAIGALAGSAGELHVLGRFFTRTDNRSLNTLAGLAVPLGVGLLLAAAVSAARQ